MVKITLEVTTKQALDIFKLLNKEESSKLVISEKDTSKNTLPKPSPKTGVRMPSFGRTTGQIAAFDEVENTRLVKTEEDEARKAANKRDKAKKVAIEESEAQSIKDLDKDTAAITEPLKKPTWKL